MAIWETLLHQQHPEQKNSNIPKGEILLDAMIKNAEKQQNAGTNDQTDVVCYPNKKGNDLLYFFSGNGRSSSEIAK